MNRLSQFDVSEVHDLKVRMVKFILNKSISKHPIKRTDILRHCLEGKSNLFKTVFNAASIALRSVCLIFI